MLKTDFIVNLDGFEGPLDLLLSLAKTQKVDLRKISILELAGQYLSFIEKLRNEKLEVAADYLVMAAWLAFIKSKLLLPEGEDESLTSQIAENITLQIERLNSIRELGTKLMLRDRLGIDFFSIGNSKNFEREIKIKYEPLLIDLLRAHLRISTKEEFTPFGSNETDVVSIEKAIENLKTYLLVKVDWITLEEIVKDSPLSKENNKVSALAATFSASLELAKRGEIILEQNNLFDSISIKIRE